MAICTDNEREFLDILLQNMKRYPGDCPFCSYDALGPHKTIKVQLGRLLTEHSFSQMDIKEIL